MKTLPIIAMIFGFLLMLWGMAIGSGYDAGAITLAISGSILVGSSIVALAILQASGGKNNQKPE